MKTLGRAAAVAAAYWVAGRLALLLAIPPGYATAVWPAAGIALVAVLLWGRVGAAGVALGSFLVNVGTGLDTASTAVFNRSVGIALVIAGGAALQALVGAALVRRLVRWPTALEDEGDVLRFIALAGPVASLVNATVGSTILLVSGAVAWPSVPFSWFTWWVGDTIGVALVAPLLLLQLGPTRPSPRRRVAIAVPLLAGIVGVTLLFVLVSTAEDQRRHDEFVRRAQPFTHALDARLVAYEDIGILLGGLFEASDEVTVTDFAVFSRPLLARNPEVVGVAWGPIVLDAERAAYEARVQAGGIAGFEIAEPADGGGRRRAGTRADYVPIHYIEPAAQRASIHGIDVASEPVRREALARALASGMPTATGAVTLFHDPEVRGFLLLTPITHGPRGYAILVLSLGAVVRAASANLEIGGMTLVIRDETAGDAVLFDGGVGPEARSWWTARLDVGGRTWRAEIYPTPAHLVASRSWQAWGALAAGLGFVSLLGTITLMTTGRTSRIERQALDREVLLALTEAAGRAETTAEIRREVARQLGQHLGASRCEFEEDHLEAGFGEATVAELRAGRTVVDVDAAVAGARAHVAVPLFRDGVWRATLWVGHGQPHLWRAGETALVQTVAEKAWLWIEHVRLRAELRALNEDLERRVDERTAALRDAVREKEILLKEIHHRVKNNLQVISSLLSLQAHHLTDPAVRTIFDDSKARVQAIALVHENLYRTRDLARIDFAEYVRTLVGNLLQAHDAAGRGVVARLELGEARLPVTVAIPCGLVISELVTNALKHAFPAGRTGTIAVTLHRDGARARLTVADDGVGLPPGLDPRKSPSLGLELVFTFAEQLQAQVEVQAAPGVSFALTFELDET